MPDRSCLASSPVVVPLGGCQGVFGHPSGVRISPKVSGDISHRGVCHSTPPSSSFFYWYLYFRIPPTPTPPRGVPPTGGLPPRGSACTPMLPSPRQRFAARKQHWNASAPMFPKGGGGEEGCAGYTILKNGIQPRVPLNIFSTLTTHGFAHCQFTGASSSLIFCLGLLIVCGV